MPKAQKSPDIQKMDHAYWDLDHQEWSEDLLTWKKEFQRMQDILVEMQKMMKHHGEQLEDHSAALKSHESAIHEHEAERGVAYGIRYLKEITDRSHDQHGKTHFNQKLVHEALKRRHYLILGQLQLCAQSFQREGL